jgi:hypothetical protein
MVGSARRTKSSFITNPLTSLQHYFYNLVHPSEAALYQPPPGTDPSLYALAQRSNPDPSCLVPVLARGFADVNKRVEIQEKTAKEQEAAFEQLEKRLDALRDGHYTKTAAAAERLANQGIELSRRVMVLMKQVGLLDALLDPVCSYPSFIAGPRSPPQIPSADTHRRTPPRSSRLDPITVRGQKPGR